VRCYHGEELGEEFAIKKTKFHGGKRILIWAAISWDGPEQLFFTEDKENTDVYEEILDVCLPNIPQAAKWGAHFHVRQRILAHCPCPKGVLRRSTL
jgi:hypothetical protein